MKKSYVHIYTGEGKGKTTAAIGLAVRASGWNLSVLVAQLFKNRTSEAGQLEKLGIRYLSYSSTHPFFKKYSEKEIGSEAARCQAFVRNIFAVIKKEHYDLVVIDEIGPALSFSLFPEQELAELVKSKPEATELVLTGRGFPDSILKLGHYVTNMSKVRHIYDQGVQARKGIEL
ncbi:cob(I)yrinic acid a,c-diamide adenosyltransferase [Candidatus Woesearchaeota archaeon]|nr:cob(I)yrinic acid a,c-diamide adenosyltransferase [Candidatus Woesearchaeota archaeon]